MFRLGLAATLGCLLGMGGCCGGDIHTPVMADLGLVADGPPGPRSDGPPPPDVAFPGAGDPDPGPGFHLKMNLPENCSGDPDMAYAVTAKDIFNNIVQPSCSKGPSSDACHVRSERGLAYPDLTLEDGVRALTTLYLRDKDPTTMPLVTAGKIEQSYVLYKVTGQQGYVPGGGGKQMPYDGMYGDIQRTAIVCAFVYWISGGAP